MEPLSTSKNSIEVEEANPIALLKNPQKFKSAFFQLASQAKQLLKNQEFDKAIKLLAKQQDMLELGKNILKSIGKYWKLCIVGNLACAYQGSWKMQKCHKFCEKITEELEKFIEESDEREEKMNLTKYYIRIKFQHCAILSQLNQHEKALQLCKSTLPYLKGLINTILQYTKTLIGSHSSRKSSDTVQFSRQVCQLAEQILESLNNFLQDPVEVGFQKSSFYYWQKNPENNEEQIKKKFISFNKSPQECKRTILGVNKAAHWIDEFNIGTIMHISEFSVQNFQKYLPIEEYIFKDKLYETVIFCSIAHFTIATQMRFIDSRKLQKEQKQQQKQDEEKEEKKVAHIHKIQKKYGYEEKSKIFKSSELYHIRSINIIAQNIKSNIPYVSHLIKSYEKHYVQKKQLEPIQAIIEESALSVSEQNIIKNKDFKYFQDDPYGSCYKDNHECPAFERNKVSEELLSELQKQIVTDRFQVIEPLQTNFQNKQSCIQHLTPYHLSQLKRDQSSLKKNKSMGRLKTKRSKTKGKKEDEKVKKNRTKKDKKKVDWGNNGDKEVRIKHSSHTQIKVFFKKKK